MYFWGGWCVCVHLEKKPETQVSVDVMCEQSGELVYIHPKPYSRTRLNFRGLQVTIWGSLASGQS